MEKRKGEEIVDGRFRLWLPDCTRESLVEIVESGQRLLFQYRGKDYLIDHMGVAAYIIVEPLLYDAEGGWPRKTKAAYPGHLEAVTPEELLALPFLDGKTMFERFDELEFFDD